MNFITSITEQCNNHHLRLWILALKKLEFLRTPQSSLRRALRQDNQRLLWSVDAEHVTNSTTSITRHYNNPFTSEFEHLRWKVCHYSLTGWRGHFHAQPTHTTPPLALQTQLGMGWRTLPHATPSGSLNYSLNMRQGHVVNALWLHWVVTMRVSQWCAAAPSVWGHHEGSAKFIWR